MRISTCCELIKALALSLSGLRYRFNADKHELYLFPRRTSVRRPDSATASMRISTSASLARTSSWPWSGLRYRFNADKHMSGTSRNLHMRDVRTPLPLQCG